MADILHADIYVSGLSVLDSATATLHICSSKPTTLVEATTTYNLGTKTGLVIGTPVTDASGGKVTVAAFSDGVKDADGTAVYFGIVDATRLLVSGRLSAPVVVTTPGAFSLTALDVTIPAPV